MVKKSAASTTTTNENDSGSYEDLFTKGWDEIPAEQLLPDGHWRLRATGVSFKPGNEKMGATLNVSYDPVAPLDDVSPAALDEMGDYDFTSNRIFHRYFINSMRELRQAVEQLKKHSGFNPPAGATILVADGDTYKVNPVIKTALVGTEVVALVGRNSYTNREGEQVVDNRLSSFSSVED